MRGWNRFGSIGVAAALVLTLAGLTAQAQAEAVRSVYPRHGTFWTGRVMNSAGTYSKHNADMMYGKDPPDDKWQGWTKLDLSDVPDNAVITAASFRYYVVTQSEPPPETRITNVVTDPVLAGASVLWNDIATGTIVSPDLVTGQGWVERPLNAAGLALLQAALLKDWIAFGIHKSDSSGAKGHAKGYQGARFRPHLVVSFSAGDMAIEQIIEPAGTILARTPVVPKVLVENRGELVLPFRLRLTISAGAAELYSRLVSASGIPVGQSSVVSFPQWVADSAGGIRSVRCTLELANDANPADNFAVSWFNVVAGGGEPPSPVRWGWEEVEPFPALPSGRAVKAGGLLLVDPSTGLAYAAKGSKTGEFSVYDPLKDEWRQLAPIPGTVPGRGAKGVADGSGGVFLVKGNNTLEFWRYDIAGNSWEQLPDVPLGNSNKRVKGGTGLAHAAQYGLNYIYLLKGPKYDFMRYGEEDSIWEVLPDAPAVGTTRWARGSWLVAGDTRLLAHKAGAHELWPFDLTQDAWGSQLTGMPFFGSSLRSKKSKDGGSAAWREGTVFALKGNKTGEFWTFDAGTGDWAELEPMPAFGTTLRDVLPGDGADIVSYPYGRAFYALKGNKTLEFWRYTMRPALAAGHEARGATVMAGSGEMGGVRLLVSPNPAFGRTARLAYQVRSPGRATVTLFDVAGCVVAQEFVALDRSGSIELSLDGLVAGTYVIRLAGAEHSAFTRLVVTR